MSVCHQSPEILLKELGISNPEDIDVEAIAFYCGAEVRYRMLTGCAARIIGTDDRAIITVDNETSSWPRQRFSIGHELGHWMRDRGKSAHLCQNKDLTAVWGHRQDPESRANQYAADLLLPAFMFLPRAAEQEMVFQTVRALADEFQTSLTATAIRLVEKGSFPAMLICYGPEGRRWFSRGSDVPYEIWLTTRRRPLRCFLAERNSGSRWRSMPMHGSNTGMPIVIRSSKTLSKYPMMLY